VTFRGSRHVADPCDFTDEELTGYWSDVRTAAKAIERAYRPCQLNYGTFGNAVPHVHTHITPRYPDDLAPGRPLPDWVFANAPLLEPDQLADQLAQLRRHLPLRGTGRGMRHGKRLALPDRAARLARGRDAGPR
jgi:diadenosine tetraphosphate (Ap4A) HIT family hydrolase